MRRTLLVALALGLLALACSGDDDGPVTVTTATSAAGGQATAASATPAATSGSTATSTATAAATATASTTTTATATATPGGSATPTQTATATVTATQQPPPSTCSPGGVGRPPASYYGPGLVPGAKVVARNVRCGDICETATANATGFWMMQVGADANCGPEVGDSITFTVDGVLSLVTIVWESGGVPDNVGVGIVLFE